MAKANVHLLGLMEIADLLGVQHETCHRWRFRGIMPEPDWTVSGTPVWERATITAWARETGRLTKAGPQVLAARPAGRAAPA